MVFYFVYNDTVYSYRDGRARPLRLNRGRVMMYADDGGRRWVPVADVLASSAGDEKFAHISMHDALERMHSRASSTLEPAGGADDRGRAHCVARVTIRMALVAVTLYVVWAYVCLSFRLSQEVRDDLDNAVDGEGRGGASSAARAVVVRTLDPFKELVRNASAFGAESIEHARVTGAAWAQAIRGRCLR